MNKMKTFWEILREKGPIVGLSPMDGVTDAPFRYMVAKYGNPDVIFTEFVSVDGLHYATGERRERMLKAFIRVKDIEKFTLPVCKFFEVAQVFGSKPEYFAEAAILIEKMGFDGMDINMGCPAKNVSENGCGAGLIRTPQIAQEIVRVAKAATSLPVSVKTRLGVTDKNEMEVWISAIMEAEPANLSLHGRTLKQMYMGEADWEKIGEAAKIVHDEGGMILGNGDIKSVEDLKSKVKQYGVDGGLIGRAEEGNPGIFSECTQITNDKSSQMEEIKKQKLVWMVEHAKVYEQVYGKEWFIPMRKHLAWYAHGFPGAGELRQKLMKATSVSEVEKTISLFS